MMRSVPRLTRPRAAGAVCLLGMLLCAAPLRAQTLSLTADCNYGFRRLIAMGEKGELGDDIADVNVNVGPEVRVELVRRKGTSAFLFLSPPSSANSSSRYFDVTPGEGATAADAQRLGAALDVAFPSDPYTILGLEELVPGEPLPSLGAALASGSWRAVVRAVERRMMVLASLRYTVGVIVVVALALLASLALLWLSAPVRPLPASDRSER